MSGSLKSKLAVETGNKMGRAVMLAGRRRGAERVNMEDLESRLLLSTYQTSAYLPYAVGNTWGYTSITGSVQSGTETVGVTAGLTINGASTNKLTSTATIAGQTTTESDYVTVDANGLKRDRTDVTNPDTSATSDVFTTFIQEVPATMTDGQVFNDSKPFNQTVTAGSDMGQTATGTESITLTVVGQESVTTAVGTFTAVKVTVHDVKHIDGTSTSNDEVDNDTLWLVKSLGEVKMTHTDNGGANYTLALNTSNIVDRNLFFVKHLYEDTLNREPDALAAQQYFTALNDGTMTTTNVASAVLNSVEYRTDVIQGLYLSILGRNADSTGLTYWLANFAKGGTVEQIKAGFYGSTEYFNSHGGSNAGVIAAFYRAFLNRDVESGPTGLDYWIGKLNAGKTRAQVALGIESLSVEGSGDIVKNAYETFLKREPEPTGLTYWIPKVQAGTTVTLIIQGFIVAPEYYNRALV